MCDFHHTGLLRHFITPAKGGDYVTGGVCLSVYLTVGKMTQKVLNVFKYISGNVKEQIIKLWLCSRFPGVFDH